MRTCCIYDGCGMSFESSETETSSQAVDKGLRLFWWLYCPKHRKASPGQVVITAKKE